MTNTLQTIDQLKDFRASVREKMLNREVITFDVANIDIDNERMSLKGDIFSDNAVKKILGKLRVKNNFLGLSKEMTPTDWQTVKDKLKQASGTQVVYGRRKEEGGKKIIDDIYLAAPKSGGIIEIDSVFNEVIESIINTSKDVSIKTTQFLEDKDEIVLTLLENENMIDIFGNDEDLWKTGKRIMWSGLNFSVDPFFERLVCTNGATAPQFGFKSNISNNKFNIDKIVKILEKEITYDSASLSSLVVDAANHLKSTNVSVKEYNSFRNNFTDDDHSEILKRWFDDSKLNRAYGCIVAEMPNQWQSTADTGRNAYSFFNDLTYIASHPDEVKLDERKRLDMQIKSSSLLFKEKLDMELVAPRIIWN